MTMLELQAPGTSGAILGFERRLWDAADRMRGHMDPAEYKHIALGLIFLKHTYVRREAVLFSTVCAG